MIGWGYPEKKLTNDEIMEILDKALVAEHWQGAKVLLILPDLTRSAPIGRFFREIYERLHTVADKIDGLIALGTHQPLSMESIFRRVGITALEYAEKYSQKTHFYNHEWDNSEALMGIGTISSSEVEKITQGMMKRKVDITLNKLVFNYDKLIVLGPVFPHEIVGFSGGNKYFFPGICGEEILNTFHWLGGLITNAVINGTKKTPVRALIDRAAEFITIPRLYCNLVVNHGKLHGLFVGDGIEAWGKAADLSAIVNIVHTNRRYHRVLGLTPRKYTELWTAGKVAYKAETIVEDGGELIIYAPHIKTLSMTHGVPILQTGYHVKDYFASRMEQFNSVSGGVLSHLVAVKGTGTYESGVEIPRIQVILASGISEEICKTVNLGYMDPESIIPEEWANREKEGILVIPDAGEVLYRYDCRGSGELE